MSKENAYARPRKVRPGVVGAIKDAGEAIIDFATPKVIKPGPRQDVGRDVEEVALTGRRKNQSTDHMN